jgi:hypothetical protein
LNLLLLRGIGEQLLSFNKPMATPEVRSRRRFLGKWRPVEIADGVFDLTWIGEGQSRKAQQTNDMRIDPNFFDKSSFRADSIQVADEQHLEQHDWVNTGASIIFVVQWPALLHNERKVSLIFRSR